MDTNLHVWLRMWISSLEASLCFIVYNFMATQLTGILKASYSLQIKYVTEMNGDKWAPEVSVRHLPYLPAIY